MMKGTMHSRYMTVEEMRKNPAAFRAADQSPKKGGAAHARFEGSTTPEVAFRYLKSTDRVLECGPLGGLFTQILQEKGFQDVHTLDFVDILEYPDRSRLTVHTVDFNLERFPYASGTFDSVVAWGIAEHLENQFLFFRELHRVLKQGGTLIFSVPNVLHIVSRLVFLRRGMFPRWSMDNNHIALLPRGVFEKTVLRYFDLIETVYTKPHLTPFLPVSLARRLLPANEWFGDYVVYVLHKRDEPSA